MLCYVLLYAVLPYIEISIRVISSLSSHVFISVGSSSEIGSNDEKSSPH